MSRTCIHASYSPCRGRVALRLPLGYSCAYALCERHEEDATAREHAGRRKYGFGAAEPDDFDSMD